MALYDLIIVGGGPAGVAAGVYASRKRLKTLFITENFEGQSAVSEGIENWIGTVKISGADLAKSFEEHLKAYAGNIVEIKKGYRVSAIEKKGTEIDPLFTVKIGSMAGGEETADARAILISTGSSRRKLEAVGADIFEHKGLTYCATCDGPLFEGQDVAVIGGGNAAFESASQLTAYCKSVTIINRSDKFRADPVTVEKLLAKPNVSVIKNARVVEVKGEKFVKGLTYQTDGMMDANTTDSDKSEIKDLAVTGIFVEIGLLPNTTFLKDTVELDQYGKIVVDPRTQMTKTPGIWAAGDCTDGLYHQNNIAAGDAVKALEDIYIHLSKR
jgi:alkyl hydroperoxide reductase subunit F